MPNPRPPFLFDEKSRINSSIQMDREEQARFMKDTRWADGLRGIASIFVVTTHLCLAVARSIIQPCCGPDGVNPSFWQLPFLRLIAAGQSWVALFLLLSGFVNSLKPLKLAQTNNLEGAVWNLSLSSFRRTFRLMLPASFATLVSWFMVNMGLNELGRHGNAYWLYRLTPPRSTSLGGSIQDLWRGIRYTWSLSAENPYDQPQWVLKWLLFGSLVVYIALLMTIHMTPKWRSFALIAMAFQSFDWSWYTWDPAVGLSICLGILLCELSLSTYPVQFVPYAPIISPPFALLGLYLMSFPLNNAEATPWSRRLLLLSNKIFPANHEPARVWGTMGAFFLVLAIIISPHARRFMSNRLFLWLGRISFPIYLLHGSFLRSVFAWVMFAGKNTESFAEVAENGQPIFVERYPQPGNWGIFFAIGISMGACLLASEYWIRYMEPIFGRITKAAEDLMFTKPDHRDPLRPR